MADYIIDDKVNGKFTFKPYNLSDIKEFKVLEENSFKTNLNCLGDVNFIAGSFDSGRIIHP